MDILEHGNPDEVSDLEAAVRFGEALQKFYPNHPWVVGFQGGCLVLRHLNIAQMVKWKTGREGFSCLLPVNGRSTPKQLQQAAIEYGGRLLEAFALKRGAWDGEEQPRIPTYNRGQDRNFH